MEKNYYEILEVDKRASEEIIKKAYNTLAKKYHPDLQPEDLKTQYEEKFKLINEAYEVLSVPEKRTEYDYSLAKNIILQEDYDAIYIENQKLRDIIRALENELSQNNPYINNITYNTPKNTGNYNNNYYNQNYSNYQNSNIYESEFKSRIKNIIAITLTVIILFLLWKIPFIRKMIEEFICIK